MRMEFSHHIQHDWGRGSSCGDTGRAEVHAWDADRHLVTAKAAYLKLRYLVDCGCVFLGHGLKKDFRMINIVVPPEQVCSSVCCLAACWLS